VVLVVAGGLEETIQMKQLFPRLRTLAVAVAPLLVVVFLVQGRRELLY
jgi:hypothetical protein